MPAVSFDSTTAPKRPRLVHVSIAANAKVSKEQADLVRVLLDPKATNPGPVKKKGPDKGKPGKPVRLKWPKDAPERVNDDAIKAKGAAPVEVVIVCSLCSTPPGRMVVLRALRAAGVPAGAVSRLGWAVAVPEGGLELKADGTEAKSELGKAGKAGPDEPKPEAKVEPEAPKPNENK